MRVKVLQCKVCGEEVESTSLWKLNIQLHLMKHKHIVWFQIPASDLRTKHFTEKIVNISNKIKEAPHFGTTTD